MLNSSDRYNEEINCRSAKITRSLIEIAKKPERVILVAVDMENVRKNTGWSTLDSLDELEQLVKTAGGVVVGCLQQRMAHPQKTSYIGKGKLEELIALKDDCGFDTAVFDDELTPLQQKTLEDALKVKILDRVALILDIFARHAQTREGKLQVELAQHQYILPRLAGQWSHLERLGGGIGTRGPGESQLETDRRLLQRKIVALKEKLADVSRQRHLYRDRRKREGIPVIALVGYTNSGKSSLLKALTKAEVLVEDKLFATLDPTTRRLSLQDNRQVLITDTVGFIKKLPPAIVNAFHATLEELAEASMLIHVIDINSPNAVEQCQTVENILRDLNIADKPRITVYNKIDLLSNISPEWDESTVLNHLVDHIECRPENTVLTSATRRWGLRNLVQTISKLLPATSTENRGHFPNELSQWPVIK
ncbi:GTPase HflX [Dehalogenimonas sp. THU2]|uniref:GTPase HflX n=1 Tax=Dehalogenimonas sp. THU2 TaxID=3151121 RepID=UPI0032186DCD